MNDFEYRSSSWEAHDDVSYKIEGRAVCFNDRAVLYKDSDTGIEYGEVIDAHALDNADMSDVVLRLDHEGRALARTRNESLKLSIDRTGLYVSADLSGSEEGRKLYEEVKNGLLDKMSFAFSVSEEYYDSYSHTRYITGISEIRDVSVVTWPAYQNTSVECRSIQAVAEEERKAFISSESRSICAHIENTLRDLFNCPVEQYAYEWPTREEYNAAENRQRTGNTWFDCINVNHIDFADVIAGELIALHACEMRSIDQVHAVEEKRNALMRELIEYRQQQETKTAMAGNYGKTIEAHNPAGTDYNKGKSDNMNEQRNAFYNNLVETRSAADTTSLSAMIPDAITENFVIQNAPDSVYAGASITKIEHAGTVRIPVAGLHTVGAHTENAAITDSAVIPGYVDVSHSEYVEQVAYSDLSFTTSAAAMQNIVEGVLLNSMTKKLDAVCIDAIKALTYVEGTNQLTIAGTAPTLAELLTLGGELDADMLDGAKWYMNSTTYMAWILSMVDTAGNPVFDPSKKVSEIAIAGMPVVLDAQIPNNAIYFGSAARVHMNMARSPELTAWTDFDHNMQKFNIRAVAGAAAEADSFARLVK